MFQKVIDNKHLLRENYSKAIINTDRFAYKNYINNKNNINKRKEQEREEIDKINRDISELKDDVKSMKENFNTLTSMLSKVIESLVNNE